MVFSVATLIIASYFEVKELGMEYLGVAFKIRIVTEKSSELYIYIYKNGAFIKFLWNGKGFTKFILFILQMSSSMTMSNQGGNFHFK